MGQCPTCGQAVSGKRQAELTALARQPHLTKLETRMLEFISDYIRDNGDGPTLKEIGDACGVNSPGTVHRYVRSLEDKGRLHRSGGWRTIRAPGQLPYLGTVK